MRLEFETEFDEDLSAYAGYDLIVAADGINSRIRTAHEDRFGVDIQVRANKFIWLGTPRLFDAFAFLFEQTEHGWIWAHAYRSDETRYYPAATVVQFPTAALTSDRSHPDDATDLGGLPVADPLDERLHSSAELSRFIVICWSVATNWRTASGVMPAIARWACRATIGVN